ncbi:MAG: hypothetical protein PVI44_12515 [Balneolaceae bacterium]|jgi:hypothetical protein
MRKQDIFKKIGFYQGMAILLLIITFVGFAPTFFLRSLYTEQSLPIRFHIHGFFSGSWVLIFLLQTFFIANRKVTFHQRIGILGALVASGVLVSGLAILYYLIAGYPANGWKLGQLSSLVWGNIGVLICFSVFVSMGIALRFRPQTHKRLMLFATLSIMGQPLTRIGHFDLFRVSDLLMINDAIYGLGGIIVLFLIVGIYDMRVLGRPHRTFWWAMSFQLGLTIIGGMIIASTEFGQGLIFLLN